jgi:hypothetical protein
MKIALKEFEMNLQRLIEVRLRLPQYLFVSSATAQPPVIPQD